MEKLINNEEIEHSSPLQKRTAPDTHKEPVTQKFIKQELHSSLSEKKSVDNPKIENEQEESMKKEEILKENKNNFLKGKIPSTSYFQNYQQQKNEPEKLLFEKKIDDFQIPQTQPNNPKESSFLNLNDDDDENSMGVMMNWPDDSFVSAINFPNNNLNKISPTTSLFKDFKPKDEFDFSSDFLYGKDEDNLPKFSNIEKEKVQNFDLETPKNFQGSSTTVKQELDTSNFINDFFGIENNNKQKNENSAWRKPSSSNKRRYDDQKKIEQIDNYYFREEMMKRANNSRIGNKNFYNYNFEGSHDSKSLKKNGKKRGKYRMFTENEKLEIVNFACQNGVHKASQKYGVKVKKILDWKENGVQRKKGAGRKTLDPEMESKLILWIEQIIEKNKTYPTGQMIKDKALSLYTGDGKFKASKGWYDKFLKRKSMEIGQLKKRASFLESQVLHG